MYIFNKHWDKVDNFRIDKYLMLVRHVFNYAFQVMVDTEYNSEDLAWFAKQIKDWFM